jgi:hypothetical protein
MSERFFIPDDLVFNHNYCFFLHDQLANIIVSGEKEGIFSGVKYEIKESSHIDELNSRAGIELTEWMENNGYKDVLTCVYYKQICVALLTDMCHFIYEALKCSEKGKLTVTFALLRKPLKDNLFYLEWLLADPKDLLDRFLSSDPEQLRVDKLLRKRKTEIIAEAINQTRKRWLSPEFIYELRYDKKADFGFEQMWQKANHLITTMNLHIRTEEQNFNFIFSDDECRQSQWQHLYLMLPLILYHALWIVDALVANFAIRTEEQEDAYIRCLIGMMLCLRKRPLQKDIGDFYDDIKDLEMECPYCNSVIEFSEEILLYFYDTGIWKCKKCDAQLDINE